MYPLVAVNTAVNVGAESSPSGTALLDVRAVAAAATTAVATVGEKVSREHEHAARRVEITRSPRGKRVAVGLKDCCAVWSVWWKPCRMRFARLAVGEWLAVHAMQCRPRAREQTGVKGVGGR